MGKHNDTNTNVNKSKGKPKAATVPAKAGAPEEKPKAAAVPPKTGAREEKQKAASVPPKTGAREEKSKAAAVPTKSDALEEKPKAAAVPTKSDALEEKPKAAAVPPKTGAREEKQKAAAVPAKSDVREGKPKAVAVPVKADAPKKETKTIPKSVKADAPAEKPVASTDEKASNNTSEATANEKASAEKSPAQVLYERLKRDMDKEQEAVITAFTDMITPVVRTIGSIQGEIGKSREIGAENVSLKAKIDDLERQLSEQSDRARTLNRSLLAAETENEELKSRVASLESQNTELDSKLNDAYAINSRESSLEAERVRAELKKAFSRLYERWLEYEFSDVSKENYESLQAIIKKAFRSLEMNGIDFKGNDQ